MRIRISAMASILILTAILSPLIAGMIPAGDGILTETRSGSKSEYQPFRVDREWDLDVKAQNWPGEGTENDPYILENISIDGAGAGYCIFIGNSSLYLTIRNCTLSNASGVGSTYYYNAGITLYRTSNVVIENCTFEGNRIYGIFGTQDCTNIEITGCSFRDNGLYAIYIWMNNSTISKCRIEESHLDGILVTGEYNTITGNQVEDCENSGFILYGDYHVFSQNTASWNGYAGVEINGNFECMILNNVFSGNSIHAMDITNADNNTISFNVMTDCGIYIDMYSCDDNLITDNNTVNGGPVYYWIRNNHSIVPSDAGQVILDECGDVEIADCIIDGGSTGITGYMCRNISISDSIIRDQNQRGIFIMYSTNIIMRNTMILNCSDEGFYFYTSTPVSFNGCHAENNSKEGISLEFCDVVFINDTATVGNGWSGIYLYLSYGKVFNCTLNGNLNGIEFENIIGGSVRNCTAENNARSGILVRRAGITVQGNYLNGNGQTGIKFLLARSSLVIENDIRDSRYAGILIYYTSGILAANNTMFGCGIRIDSSNKDDWLEQDIRSSNKVNGRTVLYMKEEVNEVIPPGPGQIIIADSMNITIPDHKIRNTSVSIQVGFSYNIFIEGGSFNNSYTGIEIIGSKVFLNGSMICGNDMYGVKSRTIWNRANYYDNCMIFGNGNADIDITRTKFQIIRNNTMGPRGILLAGSESERTWEQDQWNSHTISDSNTVNGKSVRYLVGKSRYDIPVDTGQLIIVESYGVSASDLNLSDLCIGVQIGFSELIILDNITADNCTYEGFYIIDDQLGSYSNITAHRCGGTGMIVDSAYETIIRRAVLGNNINGLYFTGYFSSIIGGDYHDNSENGITAAVSWSTIVGNDASGNDITGMWILGDYNEILNNSCEGNGQGGIDMSVGNAVIDGNVISGSDLGLDFAFSDYSVVSNNTISGNVRGWRMFNSDENLIRGNDISFNTGIGLDIADNSHGNLIYLNNFIDNGKQVATDTILNDFDNGSYGNYWSDYEERYVPPALNDGLIWDTPYEIPVIIGEYDHYPLVRKYVIFDRDAPVFISDNTPEWVRAGQNLTFSVHVVDNIRTTLVSVEYWIWTGNHTTVNMTEVDFETFELDIQVNYSEYNLFYRFRAYDSSGNSDMSVTKQVRIIDDNAPLILEDRTPSFATTGDPFSFLVVVSDDVGLDRVAVSYSFGNTTWIRDHLNGTYVFSLDIDIPSNSTAPLYYSFTASDISGNERITGIKIVEIVDDDDPTANAGENVTIYTGTELTFDGSGSYDNIGIINYNWTFDQGLTSILMTGHNPIFNFTVPGRYEITLNVSDPSGNTAVDTTTVTVITRNPDTVIVTVGPVMDIDNNIIDGASVSLEFQSNTYDAESDQNGYAEITIPGSAIGRTVTITISKEGYEDAIYTAVVGTDGSLTGDIPRLIPLSEDDNDTPDPGEPIFIIILVAALITVGLLALTLIIIKMKRKDEEISEE